MFRSHTERGAKLQGRNPPDGRSNRDTSPCCHGSEFPLPPLFGRLMAMDNLRWDWGLWCCAALTLAVSFVFPGCSEDDACEGDALLRGQADLDKLAALSCGTLTGNLVIDHSQLTSVDGLESLRHIYGVLTITDNEVLESLSGLANLETVGTGLVPEGASGGDLSVSNNPNLTAISLTNLTEVGGIFHIGGNRNLTDLDGLESLRRAYAIDLHRVPALTEIGGLSGLSSVSWVSIREMTSLQTLDGLGGLTTTGGSVLIDTNPSLTTINALENLVWVGGDLGISSNGMLEEISLPNLERVGGNVYSLVSGNLVLTSNASLETLSLPSLTEVGGQLSIMSNPLVPSFDGLSAVASIGQGFSLLITANDSLTSIAGLSGLSAAGEVKVSENPLLTSLEGLEGIQEVRAEVVINQNSSLTDLDGLSGLREVGSHIKIWGNEALIDIDGLASLETAGGNFEVIRNVNLGQIVGIDQLVSIEGDLLIYENLITTLSGFTGLETINGSLELAGEPVTGIEGLNALAEIAANFTVEGNGALTHLEGLAALTRVGGNLSISANGQLPSCLVGTLLDQLGDDGVAGTITTENNDDDATCE